MPVIMKPIILSNRGMEASSEAGDDEQVSCDPEFMNLLAKHLGYELEKRKLPNEIHMNLVYKGGYICRRYSTTRNEKELLDLGIKAQVQSLQVEYDTAITHNQVSLEPNLENIKALHEAFSVAILNAFTDYIELDIV